MNQSRLGADTGLPRVVSPDASLTDEPEYGDVGPVADTLTYPLGDRTPQLGEVIPVADGIGWARIPMPGSLGHINSWLLDDGDGPDGVAVVDTGLMLRDCSDAWKALFAGDLKDRRFTRVMCTHLHPDHIGLAGWLAKKFDLTLWMTRGEMLTARMLVADARPEPPQEYLTMQRAAGWDEDALDAARSRGWGRFAMVMHALPTSYRRIVDGEVLDFGRHQWRVVVGSGHSPEHACLLNETTGVLVSGDQVLPKISSNVSVVVTEPDADPLGEWLASIDRLLTLPADLLVCPAHGEPFRGLHTRLIALRDEHRGRLDRLAEAAADKPMRVLDAFPMLFRRNLTDEHQDLATGEALAHFRRLEVEGRVRRETRDGVWWFSAA